MRKTLYILIFIITVISTWLLTGCTEEANIQVTFIPASAGEQNTLQPALSSEASPLPVVSGEAPLPSGKITDETFTADLNSDGVEETIAFNSMEIESGGGVDYLTVMTVSGGQGTYTENIEGCIYAFSYIIRAPGGKVCLLIGLEDFVAYDSEIYSFDGIRPVKQHDLGHITGVSGTDITEEGPIDVFGTWHYTRIYKLTGDLSLEPGEYQIIMEDRKSLRTIKELPVELLKNGVYTKAYIDAGKDIIPVSMDGNSHLIFRLEDGSEGRISFTYANNDDTYDKSNDPYYTICLIDGKSEFEYLENIEYTDMWY